MSRYRICKMIGFSEATMSRFMKGKAGLSLQSIVKFNYQVALGDQSLTLAELEALARMKVPLVRLRVSGSRSTPKRSAPRSNC